MFDGFIGYDSRQYSHVCLVSDRGIEVEFFMSVEQNLIPLVDTVDLRRQLMVVRLAVVVLRSLGKSMRLLLLAYWVQCDSVLWLWILQMGVFFAGTDNLGMVPRYLFQ